MKRENCKNRENLGKKRLEQKFLGKKMLKNNLIKIIEKRYFNLKNVEKSLDKKQVFKKCWKTNFETKFWNKNVEKKILRKKF